jgi:hypothetical protein
LLCHDLNIAIFCKTNCARCKQFQNRTRMAVKWRRTLTKCVAENVNIYAGNWPISHRILDLNEIDYYASLRVCESCESASRASHAGRASHASDRGGSRGSQISHATNVKKAYKKFWTKVFEFFPSANTSFYFWSRNQNSITLQHINFDQFLHIEPAID